MTDHHDWRVTISVTDPAQVPYAKRAVAGLQVAEDVHHRLGRAVAVGAGDSQIYLYTGTETAAQEAAAVAGQGLAAQGIRASSALHRWHPLEERWEDADVALPRTDEQRLAEHRRLLADETAESLASGVPQWQARVELPSHREAVALADRLRGEGRAALRRWRFLVVGASNEDEARQLAARLRQEAPAGATVRAEHSGVFLPFIPF